MNKFLLMSSGILLSTFAFGQFNPSTPPTMGSAQEVILNESKAAGTCGNDTILYTLSKATTTEAQTVNGPGFYVEVANRYEAPQEITVYGLCYYAYVDGSGSGPAVVSLRMYDEDGAGLPGTILASAADAVPIGTGTPFSDFRRCVTWSAPVTISDNYWVSVNAATTTEPLGVTRNSFAFADGAGEGNSAVYFDDLSGAGYVRWYDQTNDPAFTSPGPAWDYDYLIEPIVSYDLYLTATFGADTICDGDSWCVETDSISPVFNHKMYNQDFAGTQTTDWGDGGLSMGDSVCNIYTSGGNYMVSHSRSVSGWAITCDLSETDSVLTEQPMAGFTYTVSNDTVVFTNTSSGGAVGMWSFGTFGTSTALDTTYVFPSNGMHDVEQIVWSASGCADTITQTIAITVGVEEQGLPELSIYPNPAQDLININSAQNGHTYDLNIMDVTGKVIHSDQLTGMANSISLSHLANGQYYIRVSEGNDIRVEKLQILR